MQRKYKIRQILTPIIASLGVLCAGSTYVWINTVEEYLTSQHSPFNMTEDDIPFYGAIVEVGDAAATLPSGFLADRLGRKSTLLMTGPLIVATWIMVQLTNSYTLLMVSRVLQGIAVGCIFTVTPMYLGEVADKHVRGMAGTLVQTMWYVGIVYQYMIGHQYMIGKSVYDFNYILSINIACVAPAVIFTCLFFFCPETPRYYMIKNERKKASEIYSWLYGERSDKTQLENMIGEDKVSEGFIALFFEFFTTSKCNKALFLVSLIALTNVTGVTPILSYSTQTFEKITNVSPSMITILMGSLSLVATTIVALTVDRFGRRPLLLFSLICCTIILLAGAILPFLTAGSSSSIVQALCVALYPSLMSLGPGTLTYALMPELFSDRHRGIGAATVTFIAALGTFLGLISYKYVERIGVEANMLILSCISTFTIIIIYKFMPETKGKTFEEIQRLL